MTDLYRCANCGNRLKQPEATCVQCGYSRSIPQVIKSLYRVRLSDPGTHPSRVFFILSFQTGMSKEDWGQLLTELPADVYETSDLKSAHVMVEKIVKSGGVAEYYTLAGSEPEPMLTSASDSPKPVKSAQKFFSRFIPFLLILFALIGPLLSKYESGDIKQVVKHLLESIQTDQKGFESVRVVTAGRDIQAGETITLDLLSYTTVSRESSPEGAVAPLDVDKLVGQNAREPIPRNSIIILSQD
jgi:DNA-directed RNA polymerase subunit RPC12/RpoP